MNVVKQFSEEKEHVRVKRGPRGCKRHNYL